MLKLEIVALGLCLSYCFWYGSVPAARCFSRGAALTNFPNSLSFFGNASLLARRFDYSASTALVARGLPGTYSRQRGEPLLSGA